ncbi:MAG: hypothetical protein NTX45_12080 [Proteobacteria bacterium]|nr:hypothetical protein [Pseudomonadota bacterium]
MQNYRHRTITRALRLALLTAPLVLAGCLSPVALNHATIAYNQAAADILSKQLLLNIARARQNDPFYFSGISNIAATFNFQANAGATPALTGDFGSTILPLFGVAVSDNPTISIVPMEGEEFTKRLLTPLQENKMTLLLRQNIDVDLLLRLVAQEFRTRENGQEVVYQNRPSAGESYEMFRRVALHLSSIQDRNQLHAEPLIFKRSWIMPVSEFTAEGFNTLEQAYSITLDAAKHEYHLSKLVTGEIMITNYDPALLGDEERKLLNEENEIFAPNELFIDIRPGFPGGEYPMRGKFRLRSFGNILSFIGQTIAADPECPVEKDPRTPEVRENPVFTLQIQEDGNTFFHEEDGVDYKGHYYSIHTDQGYPWNKKAFVLLAQIFQMTMAEVPRIGVPSITIAK